MSNVNIFHVFYIFFILSWVYIIKANHRTENTSMKLFKNTKANFTLNTCIFLFKIVPNFYLNSLPLTIFRGFFILQPLSIIVVISMEKEEPESLNQISGKAVAVLYQRHCSLITAGIIAFSPFCSALYYNSSMPHWPSLIFINCTNHIPLFAPLLLY